MNKLSSVITAISATIAASIRVIRPTSVRIDPFRR